MSYFSSNPTLLQSASRILLSLCLATGAIVEGAIAQTLDAASTNTRGDRVFTLNSRDYYGSEIYLTRTDSARLTQLTHNSGFDSQPVWSPDGTKIAFQRAAVMGQTDIWVMNADGSNPVNLTNTPNQTASEQSPVWSPDGTKIAFISTSGSSNWQLWVMNADGSEARRLVNNNALNSTRPSWSTDSTTIQFWGNVCSHHACSAAKPYSIKLGTQLAEATSTQF